MAVLARGRRVLLLRYGVAAAASVALEQTLPRDALCLPGVSDFAASWSGVLRLLDLVSERLGVEHVRRVLRDHRAAASLLFPKLGVQLTAAERRHQQAMAAVCDSHLTHNHAVKAPLFDAWGRLLSALLEGATDTLIVPLYHLMDEESLQALRALARLAPDCGPDLILGYDAAAAPDLDERGLVSRIPRRVLNHLLDAFLSLPFAEKRSAATPLPHTFIRAVDAWQGVADRLGGDFLGEDPEHTALAMLASFAPASATLSGAIVAAMAAAYRRFGFLSTTWLGARFLDLCDSTALPAERSTARQLLGSAAHNVQFLRGDNRLLGPFLEGLYRRLLADEERPLSRVAVYYRMAVAIGRRQHRFDDAFEWVDRILTEAPKLELSPFDRAYHTAWALNFRAYLWSRCGQIERVVSDSVRGYEELARLTPDEVPPSRRADFRFIQSTLIQHACAMSLDLGRLDDWERWLHLAGKLELDEPWAPRYRSAAWIRYYTDQVLLEAALAYATDGLANATRHLEGRTILAYLNEIGVLCYQLGHFDRATQALEEARRLRSRLLGTDELPAVDRTLALVHFRAGRFDAAEAILVELLRLEPAGLQERAWRAQLLALLAATIAHAGDDGTTAARTREALALCRELGGRDLLVRTLVWIGHASSTLRRDDEARDVWTALLRAAERGENAPPPPAGPVLTARIHLARLDPNALEPAAVDRLVSGIPAALQEADTWWEIPVAIDVLLDATKRGLLDLDAPSIRRCVSIFVAAARQRRGADHQLREFLRLLPEEVAARAQSLWPPGFGGRAA
jgi:tetratricopeptide (TPR) repeat protein